MRSLAVFVPVWPVNVRFARQVWRLQLHMDVGH
jgi:hypothetical protein